jgi:hypothetical protein
MEFNGRYMLQDDGETPIAVDDLFVWGRWLEDQRGRRVMQTRLGWPTYSYTYFLSTVFLGLDHNFAAGPPVLWETMIFRQRRRDGTPPRFRFQRARPRFRRSCRRPTDHLGFDEWQDRYTSFADAISGHLAAEARIYQALVALRPTNTPPKCRAEWMSPAALRHLGSRRT